MGGVYQVMCGISGIWNLNGKAIAEKVITNFNDTLKHRGPDGSGVYIDDRNTIALAHRRLSILDLSEMGKQPMVNEEWGLVITYNGEVFNYVELRDELKSKGYSFKTRTDTEVILAAYKEWGDKCMYRFNGMWAFAIWDVNKETLFVCRDRFGVKPLYYTYTPGQLFAFASETVAFGSLDGFQKRFSNRNLNLGIRYWRYLEMAGETIYEDIKKLYPGHYIEFKKGGTPVFKKWWETDEHLVDVPAKYEDQVAQFKELFVDSCRIRLRSDVTIGTALSGGLDSSSVYSTVRQLYKNQLFDTTNTPNDWQTAFIATFPGTGMDEREYADEVIKYTQGYPKYIYQSDENLADEIIEDVVLEDFIYMSPPVANSIYREMRKNGVKVSLDGHGADELMFGYPDMVADWISIEKDEETKKMLKGTLSGMLNKSDSEFRLNSPVNASRTFTQQLYDFLPESVKYKYRKKVFDKQKGKTWMREYYEPDVLPEYKNRDGVYSIPYTRFHRDTLPTLLRNWDRGSMQHGFPFYV